jgi:putative spermidine/putrescine transport system permease protein
LSRRSFDRQALLVLPGLALVLVLFAGPVLWLLVRSLTQPSLGLQNYLVLVERPIFLKVLWNTVVISVTVTALALVIGYPVAYTMANGSDRVRRFLMFIVLIPFWTSILVRSFAWMVLLQKRGLINQLLVNLGIVGEPLQLIYNRTGVLVGMVQILLPFMIFPLYSVMSRIDRQLAPAAGTLGAPPTQAFLRVYLPLTLPGIMTGAMLVFVISLGYYITPALLGGLGDVMIAQMIEAQIADFGNWGLASALSVVLLATTALLLGTLHRFYGLGSAWRR